MIDLSDEAIRKDCPHCSITTQEYFCGLSETKDFRVFCDSYALTQGHILLIPKKHISCIGAYDNKLLELFRQQYDLAGRFMKRTYGDYVIFEHGVFGQSVYHSHIHFLPFQGGIDEIIPEGVNAYVPISDISELQKYFQKDGGYLFVSIGGQAWVVDPKLTTPRFFRKRFADALGVSEREDWKAMHSKEATMTHINDENRQVQAKWEAYASGAEK